jgi:chorismate mutase
MTSANSKDDLNSLLEERARYERWIAQLTAKRDQTPPHVFERVRSDYASRLEAVVGQLRNHGEELQSSAASIEQRASAIASEEQQRRDARAEIELRAMVGEYSTERANMELAAIDAEIGRLVSERATAAAELGRLKEILGLVKQPDARPAPPLPTSAR